MRSLVALSFPLNALPRRSFWLFARVRELISECSRIPIRELPLSRTFLSSVFGWGIFRGFWLVGAGFVFFPAFGWWGRDYFFPGFWLVGALVNFYAVLLVFRGFMIYIILHCDVL